MLQQPARALRLYVRMFEVRKGFIEVPSLRMMAASSASVKLASVKHELYHPLLPTLRRMDMDDVGKRLPDEHSRTSTPCTRGMFENARSTLRIPKESLHCKRMVNCYTRTALKTYQPLTVPSYTDSWNATLDLLRTSVPVQTGSSEVITGLEMRAKLPAITSAWQYSSGHRRATPARPLPTNMYSRHRQMRRPLSAYQWK